MSEPETIKINEVEYVKKDSLSCPAEALNGMSYCIIRTYSAGVFAGYVESQNGQEVVIRQARRLWYWDGAASLSQLAIDGVSKPQSCKFPMKVSKIKVLQAIEIIECSGKAKKSIEGVSVWKC